MKINFDELFKPLATSESRSNFKQESKVSQASTTFGIE